MQKTNTGVDTMIDLKSILQQHPNCLNSRASFKSILMDKYPTEKRMVNILTTLYECGVANKIRAKKNIDANEMQILISQLENEYGISGQYSQDAILIWAKAFDITAPATRLNITETASSENKNVFIPKPVNYVQGDVNDYDIVQEVDGYYISCFYGFEEDEMTIPSIIDGKPVVGIEPQVFKGLLIAKTIYISDGIKVISEEAFSNCSELINIHLPRTLETLGNRAFSMCPKLTDIEIPDNIQTIPKGCFKECRSLEKVKLPISLKQICEGAFAHGACLKEIRIPVGTLTIEPGAFFSNYSLETVYIPQSVTTIGILNFVCGLRSSNRSSNTTIYCAGESAAMEYARKNNIKCAKAQF